MVAANPGEARTILRMLDPDEAEAAPEAVEDVPADYVPLGQSDELPDALRDLRALGFAVVDD
jgi:hypothetical protein